MQSSEPITSLTNNSPCSEDNVMSKKTSVEVVFKQGVPRSCTYEDVAECYFDNGFLTISYTSGAGISKTARHSVDDIKDVYEETK